MAVDRAKLVQLEADLAELDKRRRYNQLKLYKPYPKQEEFHALGAGKSERLLRAANQVGKTYCGSNEVAMHLTGLYPIWWKGRRWNRPTVWIVASKTGLLTRRGVQKYMFGEPGVAEMKGTGSIPKNAILDVSLSKGVPDLFDTVQVQHYDKNGIPDGISICILKSYDQGREKWQADTVDGVWFDEEPPEDIYGEGTTRVAATGGIVFLTFTPLKGMSNVVKRYMDTYSPDRETVIMTLDDATHMTAELKAAMLAKMLPHEREARSMGIPIQGEGRIFLCPESVILVDPIYPMIRHWKYIWGFDFGGVSDKAHPFAAVLLGWDVDADCVYVCHEVRMKPDFGQVFRPLDHAQPILPFGRIPVAWPQDGTAHETSGETIASQYAKHGLYMLPEHATFPDGGLSTEAAIMDMDERMMQGRFRVFRTCPMWLNEYRNYHREDGKIIKLDDDLLSATQKGIMMLRKARPLPDRQGQSAARKVIMASNVDFPLV